MFIITAVVVCRNRTLKYTPLAAHRIRIHVTTIAMYGKTTK